ncbi:MAG: aminotransferase class I/II-fold pyridoxal phosphate-dependent enzyme [Oscillospiraceae bacterium]|nr:aminotransferase class I/II-fold pyridoxal phosphate-dependent enzyme [Oscillospiraceae bacterium]
MYEYSHGGNAVFEYGHKHVVDLSASINPLGIPENVASAIVQDVSNIKRYPDSFSTLLREKTSAFEGIDPDCIFFANGASDIIFRLPRAVEAAKIMVCAPSFADYERSARSYGAQICRHMLSKDNGFALDDGLVQAVQAEKPKLVYICNPNNPTGQLTEVALIRAVLDVCKQIGAWVVVDECFIDFTEHVSAYTSKALFNNYSNLIILKAFTKLFALPGIRLGYALCSDKTLIDRLYFHGADWAVSNLAQAAGLAALDDAHVYIERTVDYVATQRHVMIQELTDLGYAVFGSCANYIFFKNPFPLDLRDALNAKDIRIRSCSNFYGLDDTYYRVAVSTTENNEKFLDAISKLREDRSHL